jgi:cyclopropane-fatty-acyl-phospholipid synthase
MFFAHLLDRLIVAGSLTYIDPKGRVHRFGGEPIDQLKPVTIRLTDPALDLRLCLQPLLAVGEAYMDGKLIIEAGTLYDFLALASVNLQRSHHAGWLNWTQAVSHLWRRVRQYNPLGRARRNASHHYDISLELYELFLDPDKQYSCAYFENPKMSLEEAQIAKKRHIMAKLLLKPGQKVLDIGCGWGGLGLTLGREAGVDVTGITLSEQQWREAQKRAALAQRSEQVRFQLTDYREITGTYDRIVSVGMFEHVGINHFEDYFRVVHDRLAEDGVALIHFICRADGPGTTNPWIRKYIFPGGYAPALSEVLPAIEKAGLFVTDIEILRLHYAETLRHWRQRFKANWARAAQLYDERFCRMWEFYLTGSEIAFRYQNQAVAQIQLARRVDTVPLTRSYIDSAEEDSRRWRKAGE